ncbi:hypothetical protein Tco_0083600 [Tanacetum coccineum]
MASRCSLWCVTALKQTEQRIHNEKLVQTLLKGHSILSLEGSLSGDCDVEKNGKWSCIYAVGSQEYQMVCTRLDIASADVGMLDKFDRGLQTDVQVFVDFDYAMAAYMTLTGAWKKEIWLKGLLAESGYELSLVAGIATGALVKGGSRSEVPAQVEGAAYRIDQEEVFVVHFFWKEQDRSILFGLPGSRQQMFLVLRFFDVKEQQGIDSTTRVTSKSVGYFLDLRDVDLLKRRQLEDKQPEEKTNTDCLSRLSKVFWAEDTTMSTYLVTKSPSSAIRFKTPIDMLLFFGWLASIKQGMLESVKVNCIFLGYLGDIAGPT